MTEKKKSTAGMWFLKCPDNIMHPHPQPVGKEMQYLNTCKEQDYNIMKTIYNSNTLQQIQRAWLNYTKGMLSYIGLMAVGIFLFLLPGSSRAQTENLLIRTFTGHSDVVRSVAFSPDGEYALSGSWDKTLKLWDVNTGREIRTFRGYPSDVNSVAFSPNGNYALSGSRDKTLKLWDVNTGREIRSFSGHSSSVSSVAFSPDGRYALSGSYDKTLKLWDVNTGEAIRTFTGHSHLVYSVAFSPDGEYALSGSHDNTLKLWDVNTGREIRTFRGHSDAVNSVAFSPDGKYALSGSGDETLKLWDVNTGEAIRTFRGHSSYVYSVAFSPDGEYALSGSWDKTLKLGDVNTGREIRTFRGHSSYVNSVAFSPDGKYALSGSYDKTLKLWNTGFIFTPKENIEWYVSAKIEEWIQEQTAQLEKEKQQIATWKIKDEYETSTQYNARMTTILPQKIATLEAHQREMNQNIFLQKDVYAKEAFTHYQQKFLKPLYSKNYKKEYNADEELMLLSYEKVGNITLKVPLAVAQTFGENLDLIFKNAVCLITDKGWQLESVDVYHNGLRQTFPYNARTAPGYVPPKAIEIDVKLPNITVNTADLGKVEIQTSAGIEKPKVHQVYDIETNLPKTKPRSDRDIAIVIGNSFYSNNIGNVDFAVNDARSIKKYLTASLSFAENSVVIIENATKAKFDEMFGPNKESYKYSTLYDKAREGGSIYIFYMGHGLPDPVNTSNAYFLPVDGNAQKIQVVGYSLDVLNHNLSAIAQDKKAKHLVVVTDACFSGAGVAQAGVSGFKTRAIEVGALDNGIFFASSTGEQFSGWYREAQHGMFTFFFLKAIHNKNADKNRDKKLTFGELYQYISDQNDGVPYWSRNFSQAKNPQDPVVRTKNKEILEQVFLEYQD